MRFPRLPYPSEWTSASVCEWMVDWKDVPRLYKDFMNSLNGFCVLLERGCEIPQYDPHDGCPHPKRNPNLNIQDLAVEARL